MHVLKNAIKNTLGKILILLVVVPALLIISEIALRIADVRPELADEWLLKIPTDDDIIFQRNPAFLDGDYYAAAKDEIKIIALGDSFTEGYPESPSKSYPVVLQKFFDGRGIKTKVIPIGLGFSGSDQQLEMFKKNILPHVKSNDIVIWQSCYNDLWDNVIFSVYDIEYGKLVRHKVNLNWAYLRNKIFEYFPGSPEIKERIRLLRLVMKATERLQDNGIPKEYETDWDEFKREKFRLAVEEMRGLSREYGFSLYLATVDNQAEHLLAEKKIPYENRSTFISRHDYLDQYSILLNFNNFIDTHFTEDDLMEVNAHFSAKKSADSVGWGLFSGDKDSLGIGMKHYNELGYWLFAQKIGQRIADDYFSPDAMAQRK